MNLTSASFDGGQAIPGHYALCVPDSQDHATFEASRNPALTWTGVPSAFRPPTSRVVGAVTGLG